MTFAWTPEIVDQMRIWAREESASQIGARIGATRNAVIGKCHRKKIQLAKVGAAVHSPNGLGPLRKRMPRPKPEPTPKPSTPPPAVKVSPAPYVGKPEVGSVPATALTIMKLQPQSCRWIVQDRAGKTVPWLYCGAHKTEGSSYCSGHRVLSRNIDQRKRA